MLAVMYYSYVKTPVGRIRLTGHDGVLTGLHLADHPRCPPPEPGTPVDDHAMEKVADQLSQYFEGDRTSFDVDLELLGTPFQVEVWNALREVPYGKTSSYATVAESIGRPSAVRAVGAANGRNPISIIVPCHRIIGADGSLTGYGWGVDCKSWLLDFEQRNQRLQLQL
jgi:methylated-DNA-[protein]-cysteine S-methyltransferase